MSDKYSITLKDGRIAKLGWISLKKPLFVGITAGVEYIVPW